MSGTERAELYFVAGMMVLILVLSFAAVYFFMKQYRKEMREREDRKKKAEQAKVQAEQ